MKSISVTAEHIATLRKPAALALEARLSPEEYGTWCYVCGDMAAALKPIVVIEGNNVSTDEWLCPRDFDFFSVVS